MNLLGEFDALLPYPKLPVRLHCFTLFTGISRVNASTGLLSLLIALRDYDL